jgi:hypothetical protein
MIIVTLMGGMGNQMFQYAIARNLSLKYNTELKIDLSFLNRRDLGSNFVYRDYDLNIFNVFEDFDITSTSVYRLNETHFHYSKQVDIDIENSVRNNISVLLNGYWQTPLYFKDFESQIRKDFYFKDKVESLSNEVNNMYQKIKNCNSVMLNVRRTDYLNTNFHGVMGMEYINKAVEIINSKIENPHYFIFSDDVDWCEENIKLNNMTVVDHSYKGEKFGYYLQLMKSCKHFIIPNSTFAWWAAWLNENSDKIVIAPTQWFTDTKINTNDLIPNSWIRI